MTEQQTQQSQSALNRVLHRLDHFSIPKPDLLQTPAKKHLKDRCGSIGTFIDYWWVDRAAAAQQIRDAVDYYQRNGPEDKGAKERYQNMLVGYLFVVNRALFSTEKGSMDSYDKQKEKRQIEAVLRAIDGEHLHMGTGEGKSTVVIPITSIVESLTSQRGDVVVSSSNDLLLDELRASTERFTSKLSQSDFFTDAVTCATSKRGETGHEQDSIKTGAIREALADGRFSQEIKEQMAREEWKDFGKKSKDNTPEYLVASAHTHKPRIYFSTEKDLVFTYMDDPATFTENCPRIFMDEADVSYNRNTPYVKDNQKFTASPEAIQEASDEWILYSMIADQIKPADIVAESGSYELSSQARSRIAKLDFDHIQRNLEKDMLTYSWSDSFVKSVNRLCEQTGVTFKPGEKKTFMLRMIARMKEQYVWGSSGNTDFQSMVTHMGDDVASMMKATEKAYTIGRDGRVVVRDNYVDELLLSHKYGRDQQLAALAIAGRHEFVDRDVAYRSLHFQSFVHGMADKLTLFSGTLMYPDALKGTIKMGSLASFIARETGRNVELMTPPEIKKVPRPQMFDSPRASRQGVIERLRSDLAGENKPILVVDFSSITSAWETYEAFVREYGSDQVVFLPPKPSGNVAEEKQYELRLKEITRRLATGQIRVAVSTGSVGTGVNIVGPDGSFPDLRVVALGLPQKEQQIVQLIGRRRKSDSDTENLYYWHFSRDEIDQLISIYEDDPRPGRIYLGRDDRSRQKVNQELDKVKDDPEKLLRFVIELMRVNQARTQENDKITIQFDQFYEIAAGLCEYELRRKIREEIMHVPMDRNMSREEEEKIRKARELIPVDHNLTLKEKYELDLYFRTLGLPSSLFWELQRSLHMYNPGSAGVFTNDPEQQRFQKWCEEMIAGFPTGTTGYGMNPNVESPLSKRMDDWFAAHQKETKEYVDTVYGEIITNGFDEHGKPRMIVYDKEIDPFSYYIVDFIDQQPGDDGNKIIGLGRSRGRIAFGYKNRQGKMYHLNGVGEGENEDLFPDWQHKYELKLFSAASSPQRNAYFILISNNL